VVRRPGTEIPVPVSVSVSVSVPEGQHVHQNIHFHPSAGSDTRASGGLRGSGGNVRRASVQRAGKGFGHGHGDGDGHGATWNVQGRLEVSRSSRRVASLPMKRRPARTTTNMAPKATAAAIMNMTTIW
jgi:hypothetical protein